MMNPTKTTLFLIVVVVAANALLSSHSSATDSDGECGGSVGECGSVVKPLQPCLDFLKGKDPKPSSKCCKGAKEVDKAAKTAKDRRAACKCIKEAMKTFGKKIDVKRIPEIPKKCNITTSLPPIGPDFNCSTITVGYEGLISYY